MKKILILSIFFIMLTGCGSRDVISKISCHNNSNNGVKSSRVYMNGTFINDSLNLIEIEGTFTGDGILEDRDFYDWFYGDMSKIEGIEFESSLKENYTFKVTMKIPNIPEDSSFNKSELPKNGTDFILYAGRQGYVCD